MPENPNNPSLGPVASVKEAEEWANTAGILQADYNGDLRIARIVTAALKDIERTNLRLPNVVQVNWEAFIEQFGENAASAPAGTVTNILLLNPDSRYWDLPAKFSLEAYAGRFWSTDHPLHPIYHEAGHFSHYREKSDPVRRWQRRLFTAKDQHFANRTSRYARENRAEFMAEVTAQLLAGQSVPSDILAWYRKQGGIVP